MNNDNIGSALQEYESQIWGTAETLYSNGFKASEWPKYMMPFFALMLVESRILRAKQEKINEIEAELGHTYDQANDAHVDLLNESLLHEKYGYHPELVKFNRSLLTVCSTQPSNFYSRLSEYLEKYDSDTKTLLGIDYSEGTSKHLDIKGIIGSLNAKSHGEVDVLYSFTNKWAQIDLTCFNNSEVTTIEEHIKHKWADISAETAGEHYTPFDVIELCTDINVAIAPIDPNGSWEVYDMTCGGGNFVFGLEDSLRKIYPNLSVHSYGQEYNDQLYALGAIEARFRPSAQIKYGNTLTNDRFTGEKFGSVIGNPPYGTEWKEFAASIKKDKTGRFNADKMPTIADSQMLFLQHAVHHMKANGIGTIVHNGSPLTSGDAGGGESNIRKHLLKELDVVHAIIQLPQNIFFNTGISTYIWVLNNAKPANLKGKVILINAEDMFTKLKKNLNKKSCMVSEQDRKSIVKTLIEATDSDICKVLSVDQLMYNKVDIEITRLDDNGNCIAEPERLTNITEIKLLNTDNTEELLPSTCIDLVSLKQKISDATQIKIVCGINNYTYLSYDNIVEKNGVTMGKGVINIKISKPKKVDDNQLKIEVHLSPLKEKDTEHTPFDSDEKINENLINDFLFKWVKEPHEILDTKEGCEINFNKVFAKPITIRKTSDILAELAALDKELEAIV